MVTLGKSVENYVKTVGGIVDKLNPTIGDSIRVLGEVSGAATIDGTPAEVIASIEDADPRSTLAEAVNRYVITLGANITALHPTIGESIRAFGEVRGVDTTGTPAEILEAIAGGEAQGDNEGEPEGEPESGAEESISDKDVAISYFNSFDASTVLTALERMIELYPDSNSSYPTLLDNTADTGAGTATLTINATDWEISTGVTVTGQMNIIFEGSMEGSRIVVDRYRITSSALTFNGGTKTITVTDVDVTGSVSGTMILSIADDTVNVIDEFGSESLEEIYAGSFKIEGTEYTIGE